MIENVCKFLPKSNDSGFFNIINLVYETRATADAEPKSAATFRMMIVVSGEGKLVTDKRERSISLGDLIIMRPAKPFATRNIENLRYVYISYLGGRANLLADTIKVEFDGSVYRGYEGLIPLWMSTLNKKTEASPLACEGVVLYTFSELAERLLTETRQKLADSSAEKIKKYIDDNFSDPDLSLDKIADSLSYSPKYVSSLFRRTFSVTVVDYIRTIRVQYACELMEKGITSLKMLSSLCGYTDPLYFSSVFKKEMGISPREHIKSIM